jgi:hypothetical protein
MAAHTWYIGALPSEISKNIILPKQETPQTSQNPLYPGLNVVNAWFHVYKDKEQFEAEDIAERIKRKAGYLTFANVFARAVRDNDTSKQNKIRLMIEKNQLSMEQLFELFGFILMKEYNEGTPMGTFVMGLLLKAGIDPTVRRNRYVKQAAELGLVEIVRLFLEWRGDAVDPDKDPFYKWYLQDLQTGWQSHFISNNERSELIQEEREKCQRPRLVDPSENDNALLLHAARRNQIEVVRLLYEDVRVRHVGLEDIFEEIVYTSYYDIIEFFLQTRTIPQDLINDNFLNLVPLAKNVRIIELLLERGNIPQNIIQEAIESMIPYNMDIVRLLLGTGVEASEQKLRALFTHAANDDEYGMTEVLLDTGRVPQDGINKVFLNLSSRGENWEIVGLLLDKGGIPQNIIHEAIEHMTPRDADIVQLLLGTGVEMSQQKLRAFVKQAYQISWAPDAINVLLKTGAINDANFDELNRIVQETNIDANLNDAPYE